MCRTWTVSLLQLSIALTFAVLFGTRATAAQEAPPDVGDAVFDDALIGAGLFQPTTCPTGRNQTRFVEDGLLLSVTGKCTESSTSAGISREPPGFMLPDGEVRLDMRAATSPDRVTFAMTVRLDPVSRSQYQAYVQPARGRAELLKFTGSQRASLGLRTDLASILVPDGWNTLALRVQGPNIWLLINDQAVLSASDSSFDTGGLGFTLFRAGGISDDQGTSVIVRNLRISALAGGTEARIPTYQPPQPATAPAEQAQSELVPPVGIPPETADVIVEDPLTSPGMIPLGSCPTGRASGEQVGEGVIFKVRGKCRTENASAVAQTSIPGLTIADGEFKIEFKAVTGADRAGVVLFLRDENMNNYAFSINLGLHAGFIAKNSGVTNSILTQRTDLDSVLHPTDWNTLAVRIFGQELWLFLNDRPILSAVDASFDGGGVSLRAFRSGDLDDDAESAVVFRNLRISAMMGADQARTPTYKRP